ncbi:unnamed protein product [Aspergillus oryzae]|nr:unnamed protein product [Aspergillus oryzae]GMF95687.1 unnamed protein product [Aspergillus oryzae]
MDEEKKTEIFPGHMDTDIAHGDEKRPPFPSESVERDGVKIHPPPTSDPLDPLNWPRVQKHSILGIVNWTVAIPALGLSVGPLFWSSLSDIYGRRIIFIIGTAISLVATIGAAVADTYGGYMTARFFQGFGVSPGSTVGMAVDIEQPQEKREATLQTTETDTLPRTKALKFFNIRPIPGLRHPKPWDATLRFFLTFQFPVVVLAVIGYSFLWYWWVLSVITMVPAAYATYSPLIQGLLFLGLFIGTLISEVCCSGRLSDYIVKRLARKNEGVRVPEMRLWLAYPAILITASESTFLHITQRPHRYIIDSYPLQSTSVVIFYAVFLNLSAFINPVHTPVSHTYLPINHDANKIQFFIANWQASSGWTWTFTAQALIVLVAGTGVFAVLQRYGAFLRSRAKVPGWVNPEFDS